MENENEEKKLTPKQVFVIRFILFMLFALVIPAIYLIVRFELFTTTSKLQIGLWGIILFAVCISVFAVLIKYYLDGMKAKYSYLKQIVQGLIGLIMPLTLALVVLTYLKDNINLIIESFYVFIPCEFVAICLNPLPRWCFENNIEGIGEITDKIFTRKQIENKGEK